MNDYFYYFGILYILTEVYSTISSVLSDDKDGKKFGKKIHAIMPKDKTEVNMDVVTKSVGELKQFSIKKLSGIIISLASTAWIVTGYICASESNIFLAVILTAGIFFLVPITGMIINAINSDKFFFDALMSLSSDAIESPFFKVMNVFETIIKTSAIAFILYNHFNIQ